MTRARTCAEAVEEALGRIDAGAALRAWTAVDADRARATAARLDDEGPRGRSLFGLPVGVKDIFDTAGLETAYGSPRHAGRIPAADAVAVARLRAAGAIVVGKTVTTEFGTLGPTDVGNPIAPGRTPGGSSSGSAAAVAAGMVPVALGAQTAGSIVRPASYCAIVGYKPTLGAISRAGVLPVSASLDTVGLLAASVDDALRVARVLIDEPALPAAPDVATPPRLAIARTPDWPALEPTARAALDALFASIDAPELELPAGYPDLIEAQRTIQAVETARSLEPELRDERPGLGDELRAALEHGLRVPADVYAGARATVARVGGETVAALAPFDAVVTPSTLGVPPPPPGTGDPQLCRAWTAIGAPCVAVPLAFAADGLPVGVQVVAPPGADARALAAAAWLLTAGCSACPRSE